MRGFLERLFRLGLRIFFREIEIVGEEHVPETAPVLYVSNHPNALLDPVFLLCLSPRQVSFLAKEPLFRTPVVKWFVKGFDSLPVYRKRDGADPKKNRAAIEACRAALERGQAIALFPEGTTHSEPGLKPLKSGAARIALSANAAAKASDSDAPGVSLVPAGLYYSDKRTFRSRASLVYGAPLAVPLVELDERAEAPADAVAALTAEIDAALGEVTLQAGSREALALAEATERIFAAAERDERAPHDEAARTSSVFREMDLRRRLIAGYEALRERHPAEVDRLADRVRGYDERIASAGLSHRHPSRLTVGMVLSYTTGTLVGLLALAPFAIPGFLVNYPAYRLIGFIASRAASADEEEVVATYKWLGSMLLFPLSWALVTVAVGLRVDWLIAVAALVASPVTAFAALLFAEKVAKLGRGARLVALALFRPTRRDLLIAERREIRDEILALAALLDETPPDAVSGSRAGEERDGEKGGSPSP